MYKFIAIADVHIGWKLFNLPELAQDLKDNLSTIFTKARELQVDYVFIVGDLFDTNKPSPDLIQFVSEQVKRLTANGITVAGIAGDHDKPVNNSTWVHLTGIIPINSLPTKAFVGFDYSDDSSENVAKLAQVKNKEDVEWIFLHGQVPELFPFCEDKKKLDIKSLDMHALFPKLKGVVLGDVHKPLEGTIADPSMKCKNEPYIGYCGSLGIVKTDEIDTKAGVLYYDGKQLKRIPFLLDRQFITLNLADSFKPINWVEKYYKFFREFKGKKPVILIEYDKNTKDRLPETACLYEVAITKASVTRPASNKHKEETINIRSSLKTNDRIEQALRNSTPEKDVFDLALSLIKNHEDAKAVLDNFKQEQLSEKQKI